MIDGNPSRAAHASSSTKSPIDTLNTLEDTDSTLFQRRAHKRPGARKPRQLELALGGQAHGELSAVPHLHNAESIYAYAEDTTCLRGGEGGSADVLSQIRPRSLTTVT